MTVWPQKPIKNIGPEDELLFAFTRQKFLQKHQEIVFEICRQHPLNWEAVYQTASLHGVAPLIYYNLRQCPVERLNIPEEIMEHFRQSLLRNILTKEKLAQNISRALSFFGERSIKVMLIKGGALDVLVYDQTYYTVSADIDLVLSVKREEITDQQYHEFIEFFYRSRLEYDYFEHHDVVMNGVLPVDFKRVWADAVKIEFRGHVSRGYAYIALHQ